MSNVEQHYPGEISAKTAAGVFWFFVLLFAAIWAILPALFHLGYRNDVIEIVFVGKEWVLGNAKHPALTAWLFEIVSILTNRAFIAPFLVGQLCTIVTVWSVWQLAKTVLPEKYALIAALAALPQRLLTHESVLFNHNSVMLAGYALIVYLVFRAFQTNMLRFWIGAGLAIGGALHNKYPIVFVIFAILLYMTLRSAGRKHWRGIGPYLTTAIATLLFLPHVFWLWEHDFITFTYASGRPKLEGMKYHLLLPLKFAASQPLYWIPSLIVLIPTLGLKKPWTLKKPWDAEPENVKECERFLFYCSIIPIIFHLLICACNVKLRMVYGAPFWCFLGLWFLLRFQVQTKIQAKDDSQLLRKTIFCLCGVELVLILGFIVSFYQGKQPASVYLPMNVLAKECDRLWEERQFSIPCPYMAGDMVLAGHAAYRMSGRPTTHYHASTWSTDDDVNQHGGIILWDLNDKTETVPAWLHERFPKAEVVPETLELPYSEKNPTRFPTTKVGVAIIPPPNVKER